MNKQTGSQRIKPTTTLGSLAGAFAVAASLVGCSSSSATSDAKVTATDAPIAGVDAAASLYDRLGQQAGITTVINNFVGTVVADSKINGYFLNSSVDAAHLTKCLIQQVGNATGGPQVYPDPDGTTDGCRSMTVAHAALHISTNDFNDLVTDLNDTLTAAHVAAADIATIDGVLGPLSGQIVTDATSNGTVYQRVGRKPAIIQVIHDFVATVAADANINGFFATTDLDRLRTCLVRQVCGIDGPCIYGQEVDAPTIELDVSSTAVCKDMTTAHAGLMSGSSFLTIDDFNALVGDLDSTLITDGVTTSDKGAIEGALGPLCPMIVHNGTGCQ